MNPDDQNADAVWQIDLTKFAPPGEGSQDPATKDIDPVAFALDRVRTYLIWIDEHRASFEALRSLDPVEAENELNCLAHSTHEARIHMSRLLELVLSGVSIDRSRRLPRDLQTTKVRF